MSTPPALAHEHRGHLYARLCDRITLENSWRRVLGHYGPSHRPEDIEDFEQHRSERLDRLVEELRREKYNPEPAALIAIPKPQHPGERRTIAILRAEDRLVLTALEFLLDPILSRDFEPTSFAYRRGLGASAAIRQVRQFLTQGWTYAAGADIDNFFDSIAREKLLAMLRQHLWERPILRLLEIYLLMGAHQGARWVDSGHGIAQGSALSPLLANFYLASFDRALSGWARVSGETACGGWVRYADNIMLLAGTRELADAGLSAASRILREELDLHWNADSQFLRNETEGFGFLGYWFQDGKLRIAAVKFEEMKGALEARLRSAPGDPLRALESLSETVAGWKRYYTQGDTGEQLAELDALLGQNLAGWIGEQRTYPQAPGRKNWEDWLTRLERPVMDDPRQRHQWVGAIMEGQAPHCNPPESASPPEPAPKPPEQAGEPKPLKPGQVVARRKREYQARQVQMADFLVTEPGTFLGIRGEHLYARREGHKTAEVPLAVLRHISLLEYAGAISGDLMVEAAKRGIVIEILGRDGKPLARITPPESPGFDISAAQLRLAGTPAGLDLARIMIAGKIRNQGNLLKYFSKYRNRADSTFFTAAGQASTAMRDIEREVSSRHYGDGADATLERDRLFAAEGQAAAHYWHALEVLLHGAPGFTGRIRHGATDLVNELLNYGYGILYGRLLGVLTRAGLNPNISFLHAPQLGKPTLLYDFIEEFRAPAVDRVVCSHLGRKARFTLDDEGLTIETRRHLARAVIDRLHAEVRYRARRVSMLAVMDHQAELLVQHVVGKAQYQSFAVPW